MSGKKTSRGNTHRSLGSGDGFAGGGGGGRIGDVESSVMEAVLRGAGDVAG